MNLRFFSFLWHKLPFERHARIICCIQRCDIVRVALFIEHTFMLLAIPLLLTATSDSCRTLAFEAYQQTHFIPCSCYFRIVLLIPTARYVALCCVCV